MGSQAEPTYPSKRTKPSSAGRSGRCRLLSDLLPTSTAMTGGILGRQLDPTAVAELLYDLSTAGASVRCEGTTATFELDQANVTKTRTYPKVATLTTLDLASLAQQGLLIEVSLYRGRREIFRGRFEEPHPTGDLVNMIDAPRNRWGRALRAAGVWLYRGLQSSGACFGLVPGAAGPDGPAAA